MISKKVHDPPKKLYDEDGNEYIVRFGQIHVQIPSLFLEYDIEEPKVQNWLSYLLWPNDDATRTVRHRIEVAESELHEAIEHLEAKGAKIIQVLDYNWNKFLNG